MKFRRKPLEVEALRVSEIISGIDLPEWVSGLLGSHVIRVVGDGVNVHLPSGVESLGLDDWVVLDDEGVIAWDNASFLNIFEEVL
jgi:hypothetical protein